MNKIKKNLFISKYMLFFGFLIINFHVMVHVIEIKAKQSSKTKELVTFLETVHISDKEKAEIIDYFNGPEAGTPICEKTDNEKQSLIIEFKNILERVLVGYTLSGWLGMIKVYMVEKANPERKKYISSKHEIDTQATELLKKLIKNTKLPKDIDIPVYKKLSSEVPPLWPANLDIHVTTTGCSYCIKTDIELNKNLDEDDIAQFLAVGLAHLERGCFKPYKNLLLTQGTLGVLCAMFSFVMLKENNKFKSSCIKRCIHGLGGYLYGIMCASLFKNYFQQLEEKACDLRAIEICKSGKGLENIHFLEPYVEKKYSGNNWKILEMKFRKRKEPLKHPWWHLIFGYNSPSKRMSYCKKYAEKLGYI